MFVRSDEEHEAVRALLKAGHSDSAIARATGIPRSTIREWRVNPWPRSCPASGRRRASARQRACPLCTPDASVLPDTEYAYLLGLYLGDGHISQGPRTFRLRFFLDAAYPGIVAACGEALEAIRPGQSAWVRRSKSCRCIVVAMYSNHWPCLFPQHGPGRKHERPIELVTWQADLIGRNRQALVRGLIHSDGCRIVANDRGLKSVRYHFSNRSEDIKQLYCESLDALGIRWTRPCDKQIAVYRKASVAILEQFIGPKR
jgi:hypothetical protein